MADCITFNDKNRRSVRVMFEPDGTPLFSCNDIAEAMGYTAARKASSRQGTEKKIETVVRCLPWTSVKTNRRGISKSKMVDAENAVRFMQRKPFLTEDCKWILDVVIPEAVQMGHEKAAEVLKQQKAAKNASRKNNNQPTLEEQQIKALEERNPEPMPKITVEGVVPVSAMDEIVKRLDNIILECALLKRELSQIKK